ncbi:helix-turn-helix domain-containing protein [Gilvimarinus chinensis]|uniref:helix-turn-helix domain-containing protein n=1 Tax=Gilvimarinus chinensis TaxID=396005 RepID=UPI0003810BB7|nr:helix-turn-helix domain-containing protein [Gilvimarinus chinensis]
MPSKATVNQFNSAREYFEPYGLTCVYWQPSSMPRPDYHNEIELNFLLSGSVTYLYGGHRITLGAGKLAVFWAAIPHQVIEYSEGIVYFAATIPLNDFLSWQMPEDFVQSLLQGQFYLEPSDASAEADARLFKRWEFDLQGGSVALDKAVLLEMHARLLRLADSLFQRGYTQRNAIVAHQMITSELTKVERMACYIMKNYTEKITTADVCKSVGLTPNYAMNLFRQTFGSSIGDYLIQHRVSHAQRLLVTTSVPITQVALESGFGSISRFNEAFHRNSGCSPRQYRQHHSVA